MSSNSLQETELLFLSSVSVISRSRTTETRQIVMTNLQSSSQMLTATSFTTPKVCSRLPCTKMPPRLCSKSRTQTTPRRFCNSKLQFSTSWRKSHTPRLSFLRCHKNQVKPSWLRDACFSRRRSSMMPRTSSKKLLT